MADHVLSTGQMVEFTARTDVKKIIVGTEAGLIHKLKSVAPGIEFIPATGSFICPNMKKIDLDVLHTSLVEEKTVVTVDPPVREGAGKALERMLELSG
jgi:quinolinate synthase